MLQIEGPDSRHAPSSGNHGGLFGGARGLFGAGSPFGGGGVTSAGGIGGLGAGSTGIEALSIPMMLQLRPSKNALCKVRSRGGTGAGEDTLEASLAALTRGGSGGSGRGGAGAAGGGAGAAADALAILASVQPLAKLAQLRWVTWNFFLSARDALYSPRVARSTKCGLKMKGALAGIT